MRIYLSGPMTGHEDFNYPAFREHARRLRDLGHAVIDPSENFEGRTDLPRHHYMRADIEHVLRAEAVAVLPGWRKSKGSLLEVAIAREIRIPVLDVETLEPVAEETILEEAQRLVHGDRGADYGHPINDFSRTAALMTAMGFRFADRPVGPEHIPLALIAVKLSREINRHKRDNLTDICGYAETLSMVHDRLADL